MLSSLARKPLCLIVGVLPSVFILLISSKIRFFFEDFKTCCKPRNLNQKRTQTRPKAFGTICPSDVAGREI